MRRATSILVPLCAIRMAAACTARPREAEQGVGPLRATRGSGRRSKGPSGQASAKAPAGSPKLREGEGPGRSRGLALSHATLTVVLCLIGLSGVAGLPPAARAEAGPEQAVRAPDGDPLLTIFDDVTVDVDGTTLTLRGTVTRPEKKLDLEARARRVPGIATVRNQIDVLPPSARDDALRVRVARAIYGHPSFWDHAARSDPPIHILVLEGRVTLTGEVATEGERTLAEALARTSGAREVSSRLRTPGDAGAARHEPGR